MSNIFVTMVSCVNTIDIDPTENLRCEKIRRDVCLRVDESASRSKKWRPLSEREAGVLYRKAYDLRRARLRGTIKAREETPVDRIIAWNERRANQLTFRRNRKVARGKRERKEERRRGHGMGKTRRGKRAGKKKRESV